MPVGRPPRPDSGHGLQVSGHGPAVQKKVDDISMTLLDEFERRIKEKIEGGDGLKNADLCELMEGFRKLVKATQRPATSITMIQTGAPPVDGTEIKRALNIRRAAEDPEARKKLRETQRQLVERRKEK